MSEEKPIPKAANEQRPLAENLQAEKIEVRAIGRKFGASSESSPRKT